MYETVNQFTKGYQHKFIIIRSKKKELAMNTKEKAKIWKEYFDKFSDRTMVLGSTRPLTEMSTRSISWG